MPQTPGAVPAKSPAIVVSEFPNSGRAGSPLPAANAQTGAHGVTRPTLSLHRHDFPRLNCLFLTTQLYRYFYGLNFATPIFTKFAGFCAFCLPAKPPNDVCSTFKHVCSASEHVCSASEHVCSASEHVCSAFELVARPLNMYARPLFIASQTLRSNVQALCNAATRRNMPCQVGSALHNIHASDRFGPNCQKELRVESFWTRITLIITDSLNAPDARQTSSSPGLPTG